MPPLAMAWSTWQRMTLFPMAMRLNDGAENLSPLPGSPFKTNGTGYTTKHALPHFGPFDLDQNLMLPADAHRLFVTNGG